MKQRIALLGSTGSIGEQTLNIIRHNPDDFEVVALTSNNNWRRLAEQAAEFQPDCVVIANKEHYPAISDALKDHPIKIYAGEDALRQVVAHSDVTTVVNALVGYAGLEPTVAALEAKKKLALANKESLVVAGDMVMKLAMENKVPILPIDSEHSAILQCLVGESSPASKIILTASGGPFLNTPADQLDGVSIEQALNHPKWKMGSKITIDSATLLNKGFEVIEAKWLFGLVPEQIEVVVHPQSVIHSMVEFADGAVKAQMGTPDMHLPIQYALTFPYRTDLPSGGRFSFADCGPLTFEKPDTARFPALGLAYEALHKGGNSGCVLNAANEVAVEAFLGGKIRFTDIPRIIEHTMGVAAFVAAPTLDDLRASNTEARQIASQAAGAIR